MERTAIDFIRVILGVAPCPYPSPSMARTHGLLCRGSRRWPSPSSRRREQPRRPLHPCHGLGPRTCHGLPARCRHLLRSVPSLLSCARSLAGTTPNTSSSPPRVTWYMIQATRPSRIGPGTATVCTSPPSSQLVCCWSRVQPAVARQPRGPARAAGDRVSPFQHRVGHVVDITDLDAIRYGSSASE
jgi:hypothetical protein